jgi:hypothetical protein
MKRARLDGPASEFETTLAREERQADRTAIAVQFETFNRPQIAAKNPFTAFAESLGCVRLCRSVN